jgi:hypothetical protein
LSTGANAGRLRDLDVDDTDAGITAPAVLVWGELAEPVDADDDFPTASTVNSRRMREATIAALPARPIVNDTAARIGTDLP